MVDNNVKRENIFKTEENTVKFTESARMFARPKKYE